MPFSLGFWATAGAGGGAVGDIELISSTILTGTQTSITFSSIPSTYRHLQVRYTMRSALASTGCDQLYFRFNGISSSVYSWHELEGAGSAVGSTGAATQPQMVVGNNGGVPRNSNTAGIFSAGVVNILDYAQTSKFKTMRTLAGVHIPSNTTSVYMDSGLYQQTTAISSLTITDSNGAGFVSGTRVSLYGIKG
jgi:hypothetical protein